MLRRIIQFGTKFNDILRFPMDKFPSDWEDSWSDEVEISSLELQFTDGSFRNLGFDQSRVKTKTINKKFSVNMALYPTDVQARYHDHIHRVLRGGVKKLIAEREDGTIMWINAEAVSINYTKNDSGELRQISYSVDFQCHYPFWQTFRFGQVGFYTAESIESYFNLCNSSLGAKFEYNTIRDVEVSNCKLCQELIIEDDSFGGCFSCSQIGGDPDNTVLKQFGLMRSAGTVSYCAESSAGFGLDVTLFNTWTNPVISFGNQIISYSGTIVDGEYLHLNTTQYNGNTESLIVNSSFTIGSSNITFSGTQKLGTDFISFSGVGTNGRVATNIIFKYHN